MNTEKTEEVKQEEKEKMTTTKYKSSQNQKSNPPGIGTWVGYNFYDLR